LRKIEKIGVTPNDSGVEHGGGGDFQIPPSKNFQWVGLGPEICAFFSVVCLGKKAHIWGLRWCPGKFLDGGDLKKSRFLGLFYSVTSTLFYTTYEVGY